jgi:hypothetical protein
LKPDDAPLTHCFPGLAREGPSGSRLRQAQRAGGEKLLVTIAPLVSKIAGFHKSIRF